MQPWRPSCSSLLNKLPVPLGLPCHDGAWTLINRDAALCHLPPPTAWSSHAWVKAKYPSRSLYDLKDLNQTPRSCIPRNIHLDTTNSVFDCKCHTTHGTWYFWSSIHGMFPNCYLVAIGYHPILLILNTSWHYYPRQWILTRLSHPPTSLTLMYA